MDTTAALASFERALTLTPVGHPDRAADGVGAAGMGELWRRLWYFLNRSRLERELREEMEAHVDPATTLRHE